MGPMSRGVSLEIPASASQSAVLAESWAVPWEDSGAYPLGRPQKVDRAVDEHRPKSNDAVARSAPPHAREPRLKRVAGPEPSMQLAEPALRLVDLQLALKAGGGGLAGPSQDGLRFGDGRPESLRVVISPKSMRKARTWSNIGAASALVVEACFEGPGLVWDTQLGLLHDGRRHRGD